MDDTSQIVENFKKQLDKKEYREIINHLNNDVLQLHNNVKLYVILGIALTKLKYFNEAVFTLKRAIELFPNDSQPYHRLGIIYREQKQYSLAIDLFFNSLKINPENHQIFFELGVTYRDIKDYPNAILYLTEGINAGNVHSIIELGITYREMKDYPNAVLWLKQAAEKGTVYSMNELGMTYREMKDYPNAVLWLKQAAEKGAVYSMNELGMTYREMKDYPNTVLWLKQAAEKGTVYSMNELGMTYREMKDYPNAVLWLKQGAEKGNISSMNELGMTYRVMKDYPNAVLWLKQGAEKGNISSMNELGMTYREMKDYPNAVLWLKYAADRGNVYALYALGNIHKEIGDYQNAVEYFNKAIAISPNHSASKLARDRTRALQGQTIKANEEKPDEPFYLFVKTLERLDETDKKIILKKCSEIMDFIVAKIRKYASEHMEKSITHYTNLRVADILVSADDTTLRYYNAVYMNDPEEGDVLLQCIENEDIIRSFRSGEKGEENNIYIGSFLSAKRHEDELVMWRTYGRDENKNEAAGCSIVLDSNFFDDDKDFLNSEMKKTSPEKILSDDITPQSLYKVIYYDKLQKKFHGEFHEALMNDIKMLRTSILELIKLKDIDVDSPKNIVVNKIVYQIISELRYFFKSADYAFENEYRIIQFASLSNKKVKIDDNKEKLPKRLHINSTKFIRPFITKIILGPKVPQPNQWIYIEAIMKKINFDSKFELKQSTCKFQ